MINPITIQHRARIAWISAGQKPSARLRTELAKSNYALLDASEFNAGNLANETTPANSEGESVVNAGFPDLALVDLREADLSAKKIAALCKSARALTPTGGVVFLARPDLSLKTRTNLRKSGDICSTRSNYALLADICRERMRLSKLAEVSGERIKTLASLSRLADFPPLTVSDEAPSVLIAGAPTPAALAAINAAFRVAATVTCTLSAGQTMRALDYGKFSCAVFLPEDENDVLFSLARAMRRHRIHRRLPIINVLASADILERLDTRAGADMILSDHIDEELSGQIEVLTRRARLMAAMRAFLSEAKGDGVVDRTSKMFTAQFFAKHGARLFLRADETNRPLSLIGVTVATQASANGAQMKTMAQSANIMRRIVRAEDAVARISPNTFVLLAAATTITDADRIAARIEGVIANSSYRSGSGAAIAQTTVYANAVSRAERERVEETTAKLLTSLQRNERRTGA